MTSGDPIMNVLLVGTAITVFIAIVSFAWCPPTVIVREVCAYLNLFSVPLAFLILKDRSSIDLEPYLKAFIIVWILAGALQVFVQKDLFAQLLSYANTSSTRGAFGLATEPSFYGIQLFFFLYLAKRFKTHKYLFYVLVLLCALFIVKSATSMIFIAGFFLAEFFDGRDAVKRLMIFTVALAVLFVFHRVALEILSGSRLLSIAQQALSSGMASLSSDASAIGRLDRITGSLDSAIAAFFVPQGFSEKFGSAWGGALNHLGAFGFLYVFLLPAFFASYYNTYLGKIVGYLVILVLFVSTVQLSNPSIGMIMGFALSDRKARRSSTCENFKYDSSPGSNFVKSMSP